MAQKKVLLRKSHLLRQFLSYIDETSKVVNFSYRVMITCEEFSKYHLEVEISYQKFGALVFGVFLS